MPSAYRIFRPILPALLALGIGIGLRSPPQAHACAAAVLPSPNSDLPSDSINVTYAFD